MQERKGKCSHVSPAFCLLLTMARDNNKIRFQLISLKQVVNVAKAALEPQPHLDPAEEAALAAAEREAAAGLVSLSIPDAVCSNRSSSGSAKQLRASSLRRLLSRIKSSTMLQQYDQMELFLQHAQAEAAAAVVGGQAPPTHCGGGGRLAKVAEALAEAPRFMLLDFRRVQGLDATAARSFVSLHGRLSRMGVQARAKHNVL